MEHQTITPKYTEYRTGLFKGVFQTISNQTMTDDEHKNKFMEGIKNSRDIYSLIIDTAICKSLDEVTGIPKIAMTIFSKCAESYCV